MNIMLCAAARERAASAAFPSFWNSAYARSYSAVAFVNIAFALRLCAWLYACCAGDSPHPMASTGTSIATTRSNTNRDRARDMEILPSAIYIF